MIVRGRFRVGVDVDSNKCNLIGRKLNVLLTSGVNSIHSSHNPFTALKVYPTMTTSAAEKPRNVKRSFPIEMSRVCHDIFAEHR